MITMMMSIIPSDMALSFRTRRVRSAARAGARKHIAAFGSSARTAKHSDRHHPRKVILYARAVSAVADAGGILDRSLAAFAKASAAQDHNPGEALAWPGRGRRHPLACAAISVAASAPPN